MNYSRRQIPSLFYTVSHVLLVLLLFVCCGRVGHQVHQLNENGIPLIRTVGTPLHLSAPFHLKRDVVFGDPSRGEEVTLTKPLGYMEVPNGLAVFDEGSSALKVFNDNGSLRFSLGRQGDGPGEFDLPWMNHGLTPDGLILITDQGNNRLTKVNPDTGAFETIPMQNIRTWDAAQLDSDRFAVIHPRWSEDWQQLESLDLIDSDFSVVDTIASVPPGRAFGIGRRSDSGRPAIMVSKPFWPVFSWWVQGGQIVVCRGSAFRVELFSYDGTPLRILEWSAPLMSVTDTMWQATQRQIRLQYQDDWPTVWNALERPVQLPAIEAVRLDAMGRVWALRYIPSERYGGPEDQTLYWDVLAPNGEWLGTQPIPYVSRYFGRDSCYVTEDREDSSVIVRYRLVPTGSTD